ncbi:unnamed protein product [Amoebophrya sp. A25]|nr:unnamed protein product [Amoebophrya sp. A25]|eukprot:GSA25T00016502001.1
MCCNQSVMQEQVVVDVVHDRPHDHDGAEAHSFLINSERRL